MAIIAVIDYGMGNLRSVAKALEHVAPKDQIKVSSNSAIIARADRVVFPGQGAIRDCMNELQRLELIDVVRDAARNKPFLGLCLGPQALLDGSDENGGVAALGIIPGRAKWFGERLPANGPQRFKIPHMGWNQVHQSDSHFMWRSIPKNSRFYFVHSYYLAPDDAAIAAGRTNYYFDFISAIAKDNIFAVQFHPEKSARCGLQLLSNFSCWEPH